MNHYDDCPRKQHWYKKCQCRLINRVRNDLIDLIQMQSPEFGKAKTHWYYSGRQDAAEDIESLKHYEGCFCESCGILTNAYKAALGTVK